MTLFRDSREEDFERNPEELGFQPKFQIVRTPGRGVLKAIVLSIDLVGKLTHWNGSQTRPHTKPWCELCQRGSKLDWHGYMAIMSHKSREIGIMEFTQPSKVTCDDYIRRHGSLRGALLLANRTSEKTNARIRMCLTPSQELSLALPPAPDVFDFLLQLWRMPNGLKVYPPEGPPPANRNEQTTNGRLHDVSDLLDDPRRTLPKGD